MARTTEIDRADIARRLFSLDFNQDLVQQVLEELPSRAIAVLLYGSRARGDVHEHSDVDLIVVADRHARTRGVGAINIATYVEKQIMSANGSLFGMHVARDAVVLHDRDRWIEQLLQRFEPADPNIVLDRVRELSTVLRSDENSRVVYVKGLVRLARYLLRTALYAKALVPGPPCFSISGIAERFGQPELVKLLSSHESVHGDASIEVLDDLQTRLEQVIGSLPPNPYSSPQALVVAEWDRKKEVANAALLALSTDGSALQYAQIPRIIL